MNDIEEMNKIIQEEVLIHVRNVLKNPLDNIRDFKYIYDPYQLGVRFIDENNVKIHCLFEVGIGNYVKLDVFKDVFLPTYFMEKSQYKIITDEIRRKEKKEL